MDFVTPNGIRPGDIVLHRFPGYLEIGVVTGWDGDKSLDVFFLNDNEKEYKIWPGHWFWSSCETLGSIYEFDNYTWT